mmetsp:Transcript_5092/g.12342  ORF Transcript_5092/g.12342 Transcript_5092/m.12342 type:complete len:793 (-) Transcript_5092:104-2482(-)
MQGESKAPLPVSMSQPANVLPTRPRGTKGRLKHEARYLFKWIAQAGMFVYMEGGVIPGMLITLRERFGMDYFQLGMLGSVVYLTLSIGCPFFGWLYRHYNAKRIIGVALALNNAAMLAFALCPTSLPNLFIGLRGVVGFFQAALVVYTPVWIDEFAPDGSHATWMAWLQAATPFGIMLGYMAASAFTFSGHDTLGGIYTFRYAFLLQVALVTPYLAGIWAVPSRHINVVARFRSKMHAASIWETDLKIPSHGEVSPRSIVSGMARKALHYTSATGVRLSSTFIERDGPPGPRHRDGGREGEREREIQLSLPDDDDEEEEEEDAVDEKKNNNKTEREGPEPATSAAKNGGGGGGGLRVSFSRLISPLDSLHSLTPSSPSGCDCDSEPGGWRRQRADAAEGMEMSRVCSSSSRRSPKGLSPPPPSRAPPPVPVADRSEPEHGTDDEMSLLKTCVRSQGGSAGDEIGKASIAMNIHDCDAAADPNATAAPPTHADDWRGDFALGNSFRRDRASSVGSAGSVGSVGTRVSYSMAIWTLVTNVTYMSIVFSLSALYFVVTGIQYWATDYLETELNGDEKIVRLQFMLTSATAPVAGVIFGGWFVEFIGGYKGREQRRKALGWCLFFGSLACVASVFVTLVSNTWFAAALLWILLFFGGAVLPGGSGIFISVIPTNIRTIGSSFAAIVFNLFGYFLSPFLSGLISEEYNSLTLGFRIILGWSGFALIFFSIAYCTSPSPDGPPYEVVLLGPEGDAVVRPPQNSRALAGDAKNDESPSLEIGELDIDNELSNKKVEQVL